MTAATRMVAPCLGLALVLALGTGCFKVPIEAQADYPVKVLDGDAPVDVLEEFRTWYAIWGLFPLSDNRVADIIRREKLTEVRVRTVDTLPDALIGFVYTILLPIGIVPQSIVVEGNRAGGYSGELGGPRAPHIFDYGVSESPTQRGTPKLKKEREKD